MLEFLALVTRALRFWTRIDLPVMAFEVDPHAPPVMATLSPAVPVAGALIGVVAAVPLVLAAVLGLPPFVAAVLAVATLAIVTGAMHEDGLADVADAFGGGRTIEHKLEIMKDPRLGSFGVTALVLVLILRVMALGSLLALAGCWRTVLALVAASALCRIAGLWPLHALSPARAEGAGAATGGLSFVPWRNGMLIGGGAAVVAGLLVNGILATSIAMLAVAIATWAVTRLAERHIGGYTGDVCGAATILAEAVFLTALLVHI